MDKLASAFNDYITHKLRMSLSLRKKATKFSEKFSQAALNTNWFMETTVLLRNHENRILSRPLFRALLVWTASPGIWDLQSRVNGKCVSPSPFSLRCYLLHRRSKDSRVPGNLCKWTEDLTGIWPRRPGLHRVWEETSSQYVRLSAWTRDLSPRALLYSPGSICLVLPKLDF